MPSAARAAGLCVLLALSACSGPGDASAHDPASRRSQTAHSPSAPPTRTAATGQERTVLPIGTGWGPTRAEIDRAGALVRKLPLREEAGQVIVAQYAGTAPPAAIVDRLHLGGVIVFEENVTGTDQIRRSNRRLQDAASDSGRRWPVFIGVDQEGGVVTRVGDRATPFPTFMTAGAADDTALTRRVEEASGAELRDLGFTVDLAPDADVTSGPGDPTIGSRSAGSRPELVARQVNAAVDGYLAGGVLPVIKHFPGHGSVPADSHEELPVQDKTMHELMRSDLVPFRSAVAQGAPAVMVGHLDVRAVDPGVPSSLSRKVVTGLLRERLGFQGLVVTDALNMAGVIDSARSAESAVRALRAGADVLLMPPSPRAARDGIVRAVRDGRLSRARLDQAATRGVASLLHQRDADHAPGRAPGTSSGISHRFSAAGVTQVAGRCGDRLVGRSVRATGPPDAVARFDAAAARAGLGTRRGTHVALVGYGGGGARADVVVSTDTPYVLGHSRAGTARIALYGDTPGAMRALVDVLLGREKAPGRLPVRVSGVPRPGC